jgi:osmotically-inducible protein OsmY
MLVDAVSALSDSAVRTWLMGAHRARLYGVGSFIHSENFMSRQSTLTPLFAALAAALALGACSKHDAQPTAGQQVDAAIADAKQTAKQAAQDLKQDAQAAGATVSGVVSDASITSAVNAELTRDTKLDVTKIDIDTSAGRVALRGTVPDADSRERAKRIALAVKGVTGVDNYLTLSPKV